MTTFVIESSDLLSIKKPITIFEEAVDAVRAGLGAKTHVKIIADPFATENSHEIKAIGSFGTISISVHTSQMRKTPRPVAWQFSQPYSALGKYAHQV